MSSILYVWLSTSLATIRDLNFDNTKKLPKSVAEFISTNTPQKIILFPKFAREQYLRLLQTLKKNRINPDFLK